MVGRFLIVDEGLVLVVEVVREMVGWCCFRAMFPDHLFRPKVWTVRFQQSRTLTQSKNPRVPECFPRIEEQTVDHPQVRVVRGR